MFNFDLRNETLNLVDDFILDHIDDFSEEELYWIIEEVEKLSRRMRLKRKIKNEIFRRNAKRSIILYFIWG
jgi:hypothetical protein